MSIPSDLWLWLTQQGCRNGSSLAVTALHQPANILPSFSTQSSTAPFAQWTWSELMQAAEKLGSCFHDLGIGKGDRVMVFLGTSLEWALLLFATFRVGACFVPINPMYLKRQHVLRVLVEDLAPKLILVEEERDANSMLDIFSTNSEKDIDEGWVNLISKRASGKPPPGWMYLTDVKTSCKTSPPRPHLDPSDIAYVQFTSGTTDLPKGCMISVQNLTAEIRGYHSFCRSKWDENSIYVCTSMVTGAVGYLGPLNCWTAGGHIIFPSRNFDPATTMQAICQYGATHLMLMPTFAKSLVEETVLSGYRPRTLKFVNISGDYITSQSFENIKSVLQIDRLVFSWGMSEGAPIFGWQNDENIPVSRASVPSIGKPLVGSSAKIVPLQSDEACKNDPTDVGELHVSSDAIVCRYLGGRHASNFYTDENGQNWFKTGDIAQLDDSGAVFVQGRLKDEIKCNGVRVIPSIIECFIMDNFHLEAVVIGIPHEMLGEAVVGIIKSNSVEITTDTQDSINKGLESRYGRWFRLHRCVSLRKIGMDNWPLGSTRKVSKTDLREAFEQII